LPLVATLLSLFSAVIILMFKKKGEIA